MHSWATDVFLEENDYDTDVITEDVNTRENHSFIVESMLKRGIFKPNQKGTYKTYKDLEDDLKIACKL